MFGGPPRYQLSTKHSKTQQNSVAPIDGIRMNVAEVYRIQSVKMPEYSRFASNVLNLPANEYSFQLEHSVLSKYEQEEKARKKSENTAPQQGPAPDQSNPSRASYPAVASSGELLRPSAAESTPRSSLRETSRRSANEWADFEQPHDLFDDLELKSIDDRHELARVLDSQRSTQSNNPSNDNQRESNHVPPNAPAIGNLVEEHKKLSLSDNNLANSHFGAGSPKKPAVPSLGPIHASASDLSSFNRMNPSGLPRSSTSPMPLSSGQQSAVSQLAAMGFDHQLCSRLAYEMGTDSQQMLANAVIAHSGFVSAGHNAQHVERALILVKGDERNGRYLLEASSYLENFGFNRDQIYAAYIQVYGDPNTSKEKLTGSDELRDKLLDVLTSSP